MAKDAFGFGTIIPDSYDDNYPFWEDEHTGFWDKARGEIKLELAETLMENFLKEVKLGYKPKPEDIEEYKRIAQILEHGHQMALADKYNEKLSIASKEVY
jgi:hypothetical protein